MSQLCLFRLKLQRVMWPLTVLMLLLQRTPVLRVLASSEFSVGTRLGELLRAAIPIAASITAVNTMVGASEIITNPVSPVQGQVGTTFGMTFAFTGTSTVTPESYAVFGILPPGLIVRGPPPGNTAATGSAGNLTLNSSTGTIVGTPTGSGTFNIEIEAFDSPNRGNGTHGSSGRFAVTLVIAANLAPPAFTQQPAGVTAEFGGNASFTVTVSGSPTPTLQWRKDGSPLAGQTGATLSFSGLTLGDAGSYDCVATNSEGTATSTAATLTVNPPAAPIISTQPTSMTSKTGSAAFFAVRATGTGITYQWRKDGVDLPGADDSTLFLDNVDAGDAGSYSVVVSNPGNVVPSNNATLSVVADGSARLVNLSTRAQVGTGGNILIPGFVITGAGAKNLLVRAAGPGLVQLGVTGELPDPQLAVLSGSDVIEQNDDWGDAPDPAALQSATSTVGAFGFPPGSADSAVLVNLSSGQYTAQASGVGGTTGVGLVELYDMDAAGSTTARLVNISARAQVGTGGDILIPGFVISGDVSMTLLIRASGPVLETLFGVGDVLPDPTMTLFKGSNVLGANDDWQDAPNLTELSAAISATGAFSFGSSTKEAAMLVALSPGPYTVQVSGVGGTTGVALVELYLVGP